MAGVVKVSVVGATGYAGLELVRLLNAHPRATIVNVTSESNRGQRLNDVYPHLARDGDTVLGDVESAVANQGGADVVFLALPHGLGMKIAPRCLAAGMRVIDLGADFRLDDAQVYQEWYARAHEADGLLPEAVYGLPELHRAGIAAASLVANPGCYPTATVLALIPALKSGWAESDGIIVDAKSGVSGSGRSPTLKVHFAEVNENLRPYATSGTHRHTPEIEQELSRAAGRRVVVSFNPQLVPITRGILSMCYLTPREDHSLEEWVAMYREFYAGEPFVHVMEAGRLPETKFALGSNRCFLGLALDRRAGRLVAASVIDNLVKGAAGQAVQNMNLMFGLAEDTGLDHPALYP